MICSHLRDLYQLCLDQQIRLGGSDLIRVVCKQCGEQEICPSNIIDLDEGENDGGARIESIAQPDAEVGATNDVAAP